jgi:hypothetical protein
MFYITHGKTTVIHLAVEKVTVKPYVCPPMYSDIQLGDACDSVGESPPLSDQRQINWRKCVEELRPGVSPLGSLIWPVSCLMSLSIGGALYL